MSDKYIKAINAAKNLNLYLKVVTSTKSFENYNSFFNIYGDFEEACRRILVLTPYKELEEVEDEEPSKPIERYKIIDGNMWLEEYNLLFKPSEINLEEIYISKEAYKNLTEI